MDIFGTKTQNLLSQLQELVRQTQDAMASDIQELKKRQDCADKRLAKLEQQQDESTDKINLLQTSFDEIRNSAIRGEVASGQKTKDVAKKFNITPARVSQLAPRRKYSNG